MWIIECKNLHAAYDRRDLGIEEKEAVKGVSFTVESGQNICILGSNGSGKTTLLRAITGMVPYSGEVLLDGQPLQKLRREKIAQKVAVMTQLSQVYFSYSVEETVMMGRYIYQEGLLGRPTKEDCEVVAESLEAVGLKDLAKRQLNTLSGGELQRAFLARTLAQQTPVLILDEPTNHLDLKVQAELSEYLREWSQKPGHTLIGVFHDIPLALALADELILMKQGQILAKDGKETILQEDLLTQAYDFNVLNYIQTMTQPAEQFLKKQ
ncbi:MAG: ABC transporter ATP-binding protein [Lachnospiraceae bacterium]|nr:ABC transporter ATP-binding protein [Lachnospiraceae bacterium]